MKVPFVDLKLQYTNLKPEIDLKMEEVFTSSIFLSGKQTERFEQQFALLHEVKHAIAVGNGTDALFLSLKALGLKHGDEVITTAVSWISSSETISQTGAKPIFVDIDDNSLINTTIIENAITTKTKAILLVHLYGRACDLTSIKRLCNRHSLYLIEDCAQATFAEHKHKKVGTHGDVGAFSFYPSKNLGAYGDAGCVITNNDVLAEKVKRLANHGALNKHDHITEGYNSRMDELQAGVLNIKLKYIEAWTKRRIKLAHTYKEFLKNIPEVKLPEEANEVFGHVYHLFVIEVDKRDVLKSHLEIKGIQTSIHYPTALPFLEAYEKFACKKSDFPHANYKQNHVLSLPLYPELTFDQVHYVCEEIKTFYSQQ